MSAADNAGATERERHYETERHQRAIYLMLKAIYFELLVEGDASESDECALKARECAEHADEMWK